MDFEQALDVANARVFDRFERHLTNVETAILRGSWNGQTYEQIAEASGYSISYITRDVGPKLWRLLSQAIGEPISKTNFRSALERHWRKEIHAESEPEIIKIQTSKTQTSKTQAFEPEDRPSPVPPPPILASSPSPSTPRIDWDGAADVSLFWGRTHELNLLFQWITGNASPEQQSQRCRLVAILGMGGMGKTTLAIKLAQQLISPLSGSAPCQFEYVIWRSLRNAPPLEVLLGDLVTFLSDQTDTVASVRQLMHWLRVHRCLIVLDNGETLMQAGDRAGLYRPGYEEYADLFRTIGEVAHQSCVVLTSREKPSEIAMMEGSELLVRSLPISGSSEVGQALLQTKGLGGSAMQQQALCDRYGGNPLAIKIVTTTIQDLFDGEIDQFLEQDTLVFNSIRRLLDQQFERLSELEQSIMYWLAINREWTPIGVLSSEVLPSTSRSNILEALESLTWRNLIEKRSGSYTQQPAVMEYVTDLLVEQVSNEIDTFSEDFNQPKSSPTKPLVKLPLLCSHLLLKTTIKDYIRESQNRLILEPIAEKIRSRLGSEGILKDRIQKLLNWLRSESTLANSYGAGNLLNLCCCLKLDLAGYNFSRLTIHHAYLQNANLARTNFTAAAFFNTVFTKSFESIFSIAWSPDNQILAVTGAISNSEIHLWRVADSQLLVVCQGHTNWIWAVAFSPDGKLLASAGGDGVVNLWSTQTGQLLYSLPGQGQFRAVAWSRDGSMVAAVSDDAMLRIWSIDRLYPEANQPMKTLAGHSNQVWAVAWSADDRMVASGSADGTVRLWAVESGEVLYTLEQGSPVRSLSWSLDGHYLASGSVDHQVRIWRIDIAGQVMEAPQLLHCLAGHSKEVWSVAFSPTSLLLASGDGDCAIKLWDVPSGRLLRTLQGHTDWVRSVRFNGDGSVLASGSGDCTIKLWDVPSGQVLRTLQGYTSWIWAVVWNPEGTLLASCSSDSVVRLWRVNPKRSPENSKSDTLSPVVEPGMCKADCADSNSVQVTGELVKNLEGHSSWAVTACFSPDGKRLASGSGDNTLKVWDVQSGQLLRTLQEHTSWIWAVAWSADGQWLASGSYDYTVKLWDARSYQVVRTLEGHSHWLRGVAFSPDGRILASCSSDGTVRLWEVQTGQTLGVLKGRGEIWSVAFSPDGKVVASGGADHTVKLWEVQTGQLLHTLEGHGYWVWSVAFSPSGRLLASGSFDQTVRIWDLSDRSVRHVLEGHTDWVRSVAFHPSEPLLASGSTDETIRLWNVETGEYLQTLRPDRPYEGMLISDVAGLTEAQIISLQSLGAVDKSAENY